MTSKFGLNPWVTIWTKPKKTIRAIVENDPKYHFFYLATIYALQKILYLANSYNLGQTYNVALILFIAVIIAPTIGAILLYFNSWILHFTGKWLKGRAPFMFVRAALSWSKVPMIINLIMWFILLVFSSDIVFNLNQGGPTLTFVNLITLISWIWSFVILVQAVQEIQGFSLWRSIGNVVLAFLISIALLFLGKYILYYVLSFFLI